MGKAKKAKTETTDSGAVRSWEAAAWRYGPPWLGAVPVGIVGQTLHNVAFNTPAGAGIGACLVMSGTVGMAALTWKLAEKRDDATRKMATGSAALAGVGLLAGSIGGYEMSSWLPPVPGANLTALMIGGAAAAIAWNVRRMLGAGSNAATADSGDGWNLAEKIGLPGSRIRKLSTDGARFEAQVELDRGTQTAEHAQQAAGRIASAMGIPRNIRVVPDADDAGKVTITGTTFDVLAKPLPWPGPSAFGGTFADGFRVAIYEDGTPAILHLAASKNPLRAASHLIISGATRTGKSAGAIALMAEVMTRSDSIVYAVDTAKGSQTMGPVVDGLTWLITDKSRVKGFFKAIRRQAKYQADWLGRNGFSDWEPGCGLPATVGWIEEAHEHIEDSEDFDALSKEALSAGIFLIASTQRPSYMSMSTEARAQFANAWCFGVLEERDAKFTVSADVLDAGLNPADWKQRHPGKSALDIGGVEDLYRFMAARTHEPANQKVTEWIRAAASTRATVRDDVAQAMGSEFLNRRPPAEVLAAGPLVVSATRADGKETAMTDEEPPAVPQGPEIDIVVDVNEELPPPSGHPGLVFSTPKTAAAPRLSEEGGDELVRKYLASMAETGIETVGPKDLMTWCSSIGRTRSWMSKKLTRLVDAGDLEETGQVGIYRIRTLTNA